MIEMPMTHKCAPRDLLRRAPSGVDRPRYGWLLFTYGNGSWALGKPIVTIQLRPAVGKGLHLIHICCISAMPAPA
jgi:uroporphyrinogen-III synthase